MPDIFLVSFNTLLLKSMESNALLMGALLKYERTITTDGKDKMQTYIPLVQGRTSNECRKFN